MPYLSAVLLLLLPRRSLSITRQYAIGCSSRRRRRLSLTVTSESDPHGPQPRLPFSVFSWEFALRWAPYGARCQLYGAVDDYVSWDAARTAHVRWEWPLKHGTPGGLPISLLHKSGAELCGRFVEGSSSLLTWSQS